MFILCVGMASRRCGDDGVWDDPDVLECQSLEFVQIVRILVVASVVFGYILH